MKVLFAASPFTGHVNPLLVAARVLQNAGHETALYTGTHFREKIESTRVQFFPLPADVDYDTQKMDTAFPERSDSTRTGEIALRPQAHLRRCNAISVQRAPRGAATVSGRPRGA